MLKKSLFLFVAVGLLISSFSYSLTNGKKIGAIGIRDPESSTVQNLSKAYYYLTLGFYRAYDQYEYVNETAETVKNKVKFCRYNYNANETVLDCVDTQEQTNSNFYYANVNASEFEFITKLANLLKNNDFVDVYFLSHTNYYYSYIQLVPQKLRAKLRLVYNTGCTNGKDENEARPYLDLGAKTYIGHPGLSVSPLFLYYFLPRFMTYHLPIMDAVDAANRDVRNLLFSPIVRPFIDEQDVFHNTYALIYGDELTQFDNEKLDVKVKDPKDIPEFVRDWIVNKNFNNNLVESGETF